jgi:hypothetical protein
VQKIPFIALFHSNPGAIHIHARSPLNQTQQHIHFAMCKSTSFFLSWVFELLPLPLGRGACGEFTESAYRRPLMEWISFEEIRGFQ